MKSGNCILAGILLSCVTIAAASPPEAVVIDPLHHPVVFENDYVRVFEALASPGAKSPLHSHPPFALISLDRARLRVTPAGAAAVILDLYPGQVLWLDGAEHQWDLLSGRIHVVGVELKPAALAVPAAVAPRPDDALVIDPTYHSVLLDNDHVRIFNVLASPGAKSPMHSHGGVIGVGLDRARLQMKGGDGSEFAFDLRPAQVFWFDDVRHAWELKSGQLEVVGVEIKAARPKPATADR